MSKDICATCKRDKPGYTSIIGTVQHCCRMHWHCELGGAAKDYEQKDVTPPKEAQK